MNRPDDHAPGPDRRPPIAGRSAVQIGVALVLALALAGDGQATPSPAVAQGETLPVKLDGPPSGPHYVGQAIPVHVLVTAAGEEPVIEPPGRPDVLVVPLGSDVRPISAGAIGTIVHETNRYRFDFAIVPLKAGPLLLPAFRARVDGRAGASGPVRLDPRQPPAFGRPPWFLGGVGPTEVTLIARPEAVRLGESIELEVRLDGPGALGATSRPTLRGLDGTGLDPEVEPLPATFSTSPPSRTFPVRFRPTKAGRATLPPVLVAWFDPGTRTYQTVGSEGVSIRVDDPPRFDPSAVVVATLGEEDTPSSPAVGWLGVLLGLLGAASAVGLGVIGWRWRGDRQQSPRRYATRQATRLDASIGPRRAELAARSLAGYLSRAIGRPEGALTPPEARAAIATATGDPMLAERAAHLVAACDAVRYSGRDGDDGNPIGLEDAPALFRDLARVDRPSATESDGRTIIKGRS